MGNTASHAVSYYHTQREVVKMQMVGGGCGDEYAAAQKRCEKWRRSKGTAGNVYRCREATAALRKCMECNEPHFRALIAAMDKGQKEDEMKRKKRWWHVKPTIEEKWRWSWWSGMLRP